MQNSHNAGIITLEENSGVIFLNGYERISRYKSHLMGIAVMIVVYGHLLYYHSGLMYYEDLNFTEWYTLGSVEMFMFISGFGIYQSLRKNRDAWTFYGRRLGRLQTCADTGASCR